MTVVRSDKKEHFGTPEEFDHTHDCQIVVQDVPDGYGGKRTEVLMNFDYYYFLKGRWRGTHSDAQALYHHSCGCPLMHSEMMEDHDWIELRARYLHR